MNEVELLKLQVKVLQEQVSLLTQELRAVQSVVRADSLRIRNLEQTKPPSQLEQAIVERMQRKVIRKIMDETDRRYYDMRHPHWREELKEFMQERFPDSKKMGTE